MAASAERVGFDTPASAAWLHPSTHKVRIERLIWVGMSEPTPDGTMCVQEIEAPAALCIDFEAHRNVLHRFGGKLLRSALILRQIDALCIDLKQFAAFCIDFEAN